MAISSYEQIKGAAEAFNDADRSLQDFLRTGNNNDREVAKRKLELAKKLNSEVKELIVPGNVIEAAEERLRGIAQREMLLETKNVNVLFSKIPPDASFADIKKHFLRIFKNPVLADELANAYTVNSIAKGLASKK